MFNKSYLMQLLVIAIISWSFKQISIVKKKDLPPPPQIKLISSNRSYSWCISIEGQNFYGIQ